MTNEKRIARRLQTHWSVSYTEALYALREVKKDADYQSRIDVRKAAGASYTEAAFQVCIETWVFE